MRSAFGEFRVLKVAMLTNVSIEFTLEVDSKTVRKRLEVASKMSRECLVKAGYKIQDLNIYLPNTSMYNIAFASCQFSALAIAN